METEKKRKHIFKHKKLLEYTAEDIVATRPTSQIIYNTERYQYGLAWSEGYQTRIDDAAYFKEKQKERRTASWNSCKEHLDDLVHKEQPKDINNQSSK